MDIYLPQQKIYLDRCHKNKEASLPRIGETKEENSSYLIGACRKIKGN